jgi:ribosomal protein S24E
MELEVVGEKENKAMKRREVVFRAKQAKLTPSRKDVLPKISAMLNAKPGTVVISRISHPFGETSAEIEARAYETPEAMKKAEAGHLVSRDSGKKGKEAEGSGKPKDAGEKKAAEEKHGAEPAQKKAEGKPSWANEKQGAEAAGKKAGDEKGAGN